jgi:hypothetical protein
MSKLPAKKKKETTEVAKPKTIKQMRKEIEEILPEREGQTLISIGFGDLSITVPVPGNTLKETMKGAKVKNRTIIDIGPFTLGVDIS